MHVLTHTCACINSCIHAHVHAHAHSCTQAHACNNYHFLLRVITVLSAHVNNLRSLKSVPHAQCWHKHLCSFIMPTDLTIKRHHLIRMIIDASYMCVDMHREILKSDKNSNHHLQLSLHLHHLHLRLFRKKLQLSKIREGGRRAQKLFWDPWGAGERNNSFV